jgi:hypothetical protein
LYGLISIIANMEGGNGKVKELYQKRNEVKKYSKKGIYINIYIYIYISRERDN